MIQQEQRGLHYIDIFDLNSANTKGAGCKQMKSYRTLQGFVHFRMTNFIATYKTTGIVNYDGTVKAVTKVTRNYSAPYQYTAYFDEYGKEIKNDTSNTRLELAEYKRIRKYISTIKEVTKET